jgi:hypothetical protein
LALSAQGTFSNPKSTMRLESFMVLLGVGAPL